MEWSEDIVRSQIRQWLLSILDERGMSPIQLAKMTGISPTTIYRALDPDSQFTATMRTLNKIAQKTGKAPPAVADVDSEAEAAVFRNDGHSVQRVDLPAQISKAYLNDLRFAALKVCDRSLELEGYMPGDIVVVDEDISPKSGDIVWAEIKPSVPGASQTVLRLFEPPFLLSRAVERRVDQLPVLIDRSVRILGTAVEMVRSLRRAS